VGIAGGDDPEQVPQPLEIFGVEADLIEKDDDVNGDEVKVTTGVRRLGMLSFMGSSVTS
jgi:hypothetical protein